MILTAGVLGAGTVSSAPMLFENFASNIDLSPETVDELNNLKNSLN